MFPLKRIRRNFRDYGLRIVLGKLARAVVRPVYERRTFLIYRKDLGNYVLRPVENPRFSFRVLTAQDRRYIEQIVGMEEWLSGIIEETLASGGLCVAALDGDTLAGFNLIDFDQLHIPLIYYRKPLRKHEAFSIQITVAKKFRGAGLATLLRYRVFNELKQRGYRRLYGGTQIVNTANIALSAKVGFVFCATATYERFLHCKGLRFKRRPCV